MQNLAWNKLHCIIRNLQWPHVENEFDIFYIHPYSFVNNNSFPFILTQIRLPCQILTFKIVFGEQTGVYPEFLVKTLTEIFGIRKA